MNKIENKSGFTLIELLIAILLTGAVTLASFLFYISEHNNMIVQQNISDLQQNLRASIDDLTSEIRNAGANLPGALLSVSSANSNPDTLVVRYSGFNSTVTVAKASVKDADMSIDIPVGTDLSAFSVGDRVHLWHEAPKQGEWFNITSISINNGSGWEKIFHAGQVLAFDALPGDMVILLKESKYYVDYADTTNPTLMKSINGVAADIYAENIYDFQLKFYLKNGDTVEVVNPGDTVMVVNLAMSAKTAEADANLYDRGLDPHRRRTLSTQILVRNNRF